MDTFKLPPPEDKEGVCEIVDACFEEAARFRKPREASWEKYKQFYRGNQWTNGEDKPKINMLFTVVEYELSLLLSSRPGTDIISTEDERNDDAKVLKEALDHVYYTNHIDMRLVQAARDMLISTNSYFYVDFDPDKDNGEGEIVIKVIPWQHVYLDPSEGDFSDANYVIIKRPIRVDTLKRQFPMHAEEIEAEEIDNDDSYTSSDMILKEDRYHGPSAGDKSLEAYKPQDMAYMCEAWMRDYTTAPIPEDESEAILQENLASLAQGIIPEVTRYMDHGYHLAGLQQRLLDLGVAVESEQMELQEAAAVGPQIIAEEINNKVAEGAIVDAESAMAAEDALLGQLEEHVTQTTETQMLVQLIQDLISQHQLMLEKNPDGTRPVYPGNLRLIVKVKDNILYDGPTPVECGMVPVAPLYCYKESDDPYSEGEIKNTIDPQQCANELFWSEQRGLRLTTNTGWMVDHNSGVDEKTLTNDEGIIVTKNPGTEVSRIPAGVVSPQLSAKQNELFQHIQNISGIHEVAQGKRPAGVSAAAAITALQDQAIGRVRMKTQMLEEFTMMRLGQIVSAFIVKYWDKRKILRVYDDDGRIQSVVFDPERLYDLKYQVRMAPGTTFGISKEAVVNMTKEMLQGGVIDAQMFFEINRNNIPFAAKILERLRQRDELMAQAQAMAEENAMLKSQMGQLLGPPTQSPVTANPPGNMAAS